MTTTGTRSLKGLRRGNKEAVLFLLMRGGEMSRVRIASSTGLTTASVTQLVKDLIAENLVSESGEVVRNSSGRRETLLKFEGNSVAAIGVNIESDRTHISACTWDEVLREEVYPTAELFAEGTGKLNERIRELTKLCEGRKFVGTGIAVVGIADEENGISVKSYGIFPDGYRLAEEVAEGTGTHVEIINNVRAQARALMTGNEDSFMLVKHAPGVGCAVISDCSVVAGAANRAGEIGHTVVKEGGELCRCGKRGCLEAYVSEKHISALYREKTGNEMPICEIYDAYGKDVVVTEILDGCLDLLAVSIGNAAMLLNPVRVIATGGIFSREPLFYAFCKAVEKAGFGGAFALSRVGDDKKLKAFSGARHVILSRVFGV